MDVLILCALRARTSLWSMVGGTLLWGLSAYVCVCLTSDLVEVPTVGLLVRPGIVSYARDGCQ